MLHYLLPTIDFKPGETHQTAVLPKVDDNILFKRERLVSAYATISAVKSDIQVCCICGLYDVYYINYSRFFCCSMKRADFPKMESVHAN